MKRLFFLAFLLTILTAGAADGQSPNATISGLVLDPSGSTIVGADVLIVNDSTGIHYSGTTNLEGIYAVPNLPPGVYRLQVSKAGFKTLIKPDLVLNVQSALAINFTLPLGALSETVTVTGGSPLINVMDSAVSTVIDRNFVTNLPLNGRSFNTLLQLTPGVVIAPTTGAVATGQFSIAGQRSDANDFTVDGVSANFGVSPGGSLGQSGTGTAQAFSALGGTSSLVSVDDLQEFRVETSSFSPQLGRSSGGQVMLVTRSGTNQFHGGIFDYFRNTAMDANDWFANQAGEPRAPEHHNDFGGFLGGPILKERTFFFLSYEGARLTLPQTVTGDVPSQYARNISAVAIAPFLSAFPQPNDQTVIPDVYTAPFTASFSNRARLDAASVRVDHTLNNHADLFARVNIAPSVLVAGEGFGSTATTEVNTNTFTAGANVSISPRVTFVVRSNYSTQESSFSNAMSALKGAVPFDTGLLLGSEPAASSQVLFQTFDTGFVISGPSGRNRAKQLNFVGDVVLAVGAHQLQFGTDYRAIFLNVIQPDHRVTFFSNSVADFVSSNGSGTLLTDANTMPQLLTQLTSLYAQDTWKLNPRLMLTYGLRWVIAPAPAARGQTQLAAWQNVTDPATFALAPPGTALWATSYRNLGPRLGLVYSLSRNNDFVLRAGWGLFHDAGVGQAAILANYFPNSFQAPAANVTLPISDLTPYLPSTSIQPPFSGSYGFAPDLSLPRSYQWNVALEKSFSNRQAVSVSYLGQAGRDLLRNAGYWLPNPNFSSYFYLTTNGARSNYHALQLQYRRPFAERFQALLSYTWSHSLDNSSNDVISGANTISAANDYSSSDFDVRHSFSGALTFSIPEAKGKGPFGVISRSWSLQTVVVARAGFPFNGRLFVASPALGYAYVRPDAVPGEPYWMSSSGAPGGQILNAAAFSAPPSDQQGSEHRNDIPGFGLTQIDLSLARTISLVERLKLQFRVDAFNVLNHPNFSNPIPNVLSSPVFLRSASMLNQGLGGLNPLFQEGGPRSLQLSLRLTF